MSKSPKSPKSATVLSAVKELIRHLRSTGTGEAKLEQLLKLGHSCGCLDDFVAEAEKVVPPGTMTKINKWIGDQAYIHVTSVTQGTTVDPKSNASHWHKTKRGPTLASKVHADRNRLREEEGLEPLPEPQIPGAVEPDDGEEIETEPEVNPEPSDVSDLNADQAKATVLGLTQKGNLLRIVETDTRKTVREAAEKRLLELSEQEAE